MDMGCGGGVGREACENPRPYQPVSSVQFSQLRKHPSQPVISQSGMEGCLKNSNRDHFTVKLDVFQQSLVCQFQHAVSGYLCFQHGIFLEDDQIPPYSLDN